MQAAIRNYGMLPAEKSLKNEYIGKLKQTYESIYKNVDYSWDEIQKSLHSSCAQIIVQTFNIRAGQNVNYDDYKDGLRIIAVGGMSLSRGLTLEGLVVSYFYRNSKMYDTLMQMGRWFGYRPKYDHLCRIFMSEESIGWYSHISEATDELREEIKRYEDTGLTPMDFGLRVRSDITALLVTARNKMRSAESRECVISLSGECIETPEIYSDIEKNRKNIQEVISLVKNLTDDGIKRRDEDSREKTKYGFTGVSKLTISDFLEKLDISPKNEQFSIPALTKFIKGYKGNELDKWDVAFATGTSWGTFGILIPICIAAFPEGAIRIVSISACMAGAVCGDHCSPISDTTIMASAGAQCEHVNHVSSQLPYAITCAAVSFVTYLVAGLTLSLGIVASGIISWIIGLVVLFGVLIFLKKKQAKNVTA